MLLDAVAVERSTFMVDVTLRDDRGDPLVPDTLRWSLTTADNSVVNGRKHVPIVNPSSSETIVLSGQDLQMLTARLREFRLLTVEATYGTGKTVKSEIAFYVRGLAAVP